MEMRVLIWGSLFECTNMRGGGVTEVVDICDKQGGLDVCCADFQVEKDYIK